MSEPTEVLFEIDGATSEIKAVGVLLDAPVDKLKIFINGVDVNRTMKISSLKIVKVL